MRNLIDICEGVLLLELFDTSGYHWVEQHVDHWRATFDVDGTEYSVVCTKDTGYYLPSAPDHELDDFWELYFVPTHNTFATGNLGVNEPFKVFGTVINAFEEFIMAKKPKYFQYTGDATDPRRVKLYGSFAKHFDRRIAGSGYQKLPETPLHKLIKDSSPFFSHSYVKTNDGNLDKA